MDYTISNAEINQLNPQFPQVLSGYLTENDFIYICQRFRGIESEAFCFGIFCGLVLCVFVSPIAFFFFPCLVSYRVTSERKRVANEINLQMFRGFQVIEAHEFNGIIIHAGRIPGALPAVPAAATFVQQNPVMIPNENVQVQPTVSVAQTAEAVQSQGTIAVPPSAPRMVSIKVPADFVPGAKIRIQNPEGRIVDVSPYNLRYWLIVFSEIPPFVNAPQIPIPPGVNPGDTIMVPY